MKLGRFIDMQYGGGVVDTERARCLASRYNASFGYHKAERSGVFYTIADEDIPLENWGGQNVASCLNSKSGDIYGKHQSDDAILIPVKEATKKGFSECRVGGVRQRESRSTKLTDEKGESG